MTMDDRDRLAAENAIFRAVWALDPEDKVIGSGPGELLYDRKGQRTRASLTSEEAVRLRAENARLRAMLHRAADIHDGPGDFCIDGRLEDGSPCPSCELNKEIRSALEKP